MPLDTCRDCGNQVSQTAASCPKCGRVFQRGGGGSSAGRGCVLLLFAGFLAIVIPKVCAESDRLDGALGRRPLTPNEEAMAGLKLEYEWTTGGFGNVMEADFTFTNNSKWIVKDMEVTCVHTAASGTAIDRNVRTVYETVPAGKTKRVRKFNMGFINSQAKTSSCSVTKVVLP